MRNPANKDYILDSSGLISIGIISLGYVLFVRPFAELHIQVPFLDFPVFIGEGLLFLCLGLLLFKGDLKVNERNFWIFVYLGFVLMKALLGYIKFGPLAFRHAALFYYPVFIIFGYSFYRRDFFDAPKSLLFVLLVLFLFIREPFDSYWVFTCFILAFILICAYPNKILKYLLLATLLLFTPYRFLFCTSRMMIVANFISGVYLAAALYFILRINEVIKITFVVLSVFFITWGLIRFSDRNALKAIVKIDTIVAVFRDYDRQVAAQIAKDKRVAEEEAHLRSDAKNAEEQESGKIRVYNPDPPLLTIPLRTKTQLADGSVPVRTPADKPAQIHASFKEEIKKENTSADLHLALVSLEQNKAEEAIPAPLSSESAFLSPDKIVESAVLVEVSKEENLEDGTVKEKKVQLYNPDPPFSLQSLGAKKSDDMERKLLNGDGGVINAAGQDPSQLRDLDGAYINAVFRLLIWRDMLAELSKGKPVFGFHFGKPLRPQSLKALNWGTIELYRDGWIEPHNSYLHIIYRAGIVGLMAIFALFSILFRMIKRSVQCKSLPGILLCGVLVNWLVAANFLLILELPYTAIPVWSLFGLTYAYVEGLRPQPVQTVRTNIK